MDQEQQGLQSTKQYDSSQECFSPQQTAKPTKNIIATIIDFCQAHTAYFDLTGVFPYISS